MGKFARSWDLFKRSVGVVGQNPKLLLFPLITFVLVCIIALFFILPITFANTGHAVTDPAHWKAVAGMWIVTDAETGEALLRPVAYVVIVGAYLLSMFLSTFFNVAFFNEILNALSGRPVSITGGFRFACTRLGAILAWSLFAGLVGIIIKAIEERVGLVGRWIVKLIGIAWSVASVFVIPVIVCEGTHTNPVQYLKSSALLLKKTWGESLVGYAGLSFGGLLVFLGSLVLLAGSVFLGIFFESMALLLLGLAFWFVFLFVLLYVLSVAGQVYRGALYLYATQGTTPGPFEEDQMNMAWKTKAAKPKKQ